MIDHPFLKWSPYFYFIIIDLIQSNNIFECFYLTKSCYACSTTCFNSSHHVWFSVSLISSLISTVYLHPRPFILLSSLNYKKRFLIDKIYLVPPVHCLFAKDEYELGFIFHPLFINIYHQYMCHSLACVIHHCNSLACGSWSIHLV